MIIFLNKFKLIRIEKTKFGNIKRFEQKLRLQDRILDAQKSKLFTLRPEADSCFVNDSKS